jgi:hypothetical protein
LINQGKAEFERYAQDRLQTPIDGFDCIRLPHLTRYTPTIAGMEGHVVFTNLPNGEELNLIRQEINYFKRQNLNFEWKVYDYDEPNDLKELLEGEGFVCGESEAFMIFHTDDNQAELKNSHGAEIKRIDSLEGLRDIANVQHIVWGETFGWLLEQLSDVLASKPEELSLYCAYIDGVPIGSGWTSFPKGSSFPELHGGAVVPDWRGKGIYGDLYRIRCNEISTKGYSWTSVDATEMSRPILQKLGFEFVCMTHPMKLQSN